jgi:hypothetical protein
LLLRSLWRAPEFNGQLSTRTSPHAPNGISGNRAVAGIWLMFAAACGLGRDPVGMAGDDGRARAADGAACKRVIKPNQLTSRRDQSTCPKHRAHAGRRFRRRGFMASGSTSKRSKWALINAGVAASIIYDITTATEMPRQAVLILQYVLLACALLGLAGSVVKSMSEA